MERNADATSDAAVEAVEVCEDEGVDDMMREELEDVDEDGDEEEEEEEVNKD